MPRQHLGGGRATSCAWAHFSRKLDSTRLHRRAPLDTIWTAFPQHCIPPAPVRLNLIHHHTVPLGVSRVRYSCESIWSSSLDQVGAYRETGRGTMAASSEWRHLMMHMPDSTPASGHSGPEAPRVASKPNRALGTPQRPRRPSSCNTQNNNETSTIFSRL